eukprot:jgi/Chlat1/7896/Chrsp66S07204
MASNEQVVTIRKTLGEGSQGKVYLAEYNGEEVVVKVIQMPEAPEKQELAKKEAETMQQLQHPCTVGCRKSFTDGSNRLCIVMEYCGGGDLATVLEKQYEKGHMLPEEQILDWFVQLVLALEYMHKRGVLHRDIKSENVFFRIKPNPENPSTNISLVKLGDFGISKVMQNPVECAQTFVGTPYYMAPEIFDGRPYNHKADIWGLGCVLYEMITMQHAFEAPSFNLLAAKVSRAHYKPLPTTCSKEIRQLVSSMLVPSPSIRPSAAALLATPLLMPRAQKFLTSCMPRPQSAVNGRQLGNCWTITVTPTMFQTVHEQMARLGFDHAGLARSSSEHNIQQQPHQQQHQQEDILRTSSAGSVPLAAKAPRRSSSEKDLDDLLKRANAMRGQEFSPNSSEPKEANGSHDRRRRDMHVAVDSSSHARRSPGPPSTSEDPYRGHHRRQGSSGSPAALSPVSPPPVQHKRISINDLARPAHVDVQAKSPPASRSGMMSPPLPPKAPSASSPEARDHAPRSSRHAPPAVSEVDPTGNRGLSPRLMSPESLGAAVSYPPVLPKRRMSSSDLLNIDPHELQQKAAQEISTEFRRQRSSNGAPDLSRIAPDARPVISDNLAAKLEAAARLRAERNQKLDPLPDSVRVAMRALLSPPLPNSQAHNKAYFPLIRQQLGSDNRLPNIDDNLSSDPKARSRKSDARANAKLLPENDMHAHQRNSPRDDVYLQPPPALPSRRASFGNSRADLGGGSKFSKWMALLQRAHAS